MPARPAFDDRGGRDGADDGRRPGADDRRRPTGGDDSRRGDGTARAADALDRRLGDRGVAVARRELATALDAMDDLTPAQRRTLAVMAGRIASGVLAPASEAVADGGGDADVAAASAATREAVERLFLPDGDERVRDGR